MLGVAFILSVALHATLLPLVRGPAERQPDEPFPLAFETARPAPSPKPTPTPKPTPRPAPTPRPTPHSTIPPHRIVHAPPRHSVHVAHQLSHARAAVSSDDPPDVRTNAGSDRGANAGMPGGVAPAPPVEGSSPPTSEPTASPTAPPACAQPNVPAATLDPVAPETPAIAAQQGISGDVTVVVSLDERSRVTGARVVSSPSALLNDAALRAARASTFRTEIRACRPIAADYAFIVEFTTQ